MASYLTNGEALGAAYATMAFFFVAAITVAMTPSFRQRFSGSFDSFLAARGTMGAFKTGVSFFAGAMGAWVVYGVPEVGTLLGPWGIMGYSLSLVIPYVGVAWLAPRLTRVVPNGFTALDFAQKRYGNVMYYFTLLVSIFYLFIFLVAEYSAAGGAVSAMTNYTLGDSTGNGWQVTLGVALISAAYTAFGGLAVSIFTDLFQGIIVFLLIIIGCIAGFANSSTTSKAVEDAAQWTDAGFGSLITLVLALTGAAAFDQSLWQRAYAAKDSKTLWKASGIACMFIVPVTIIFGIAGIVGRAEFPEDSLAVSPAQSPPCYPHGPVLSSSEGPRAPDSLGMGCRGRKISRMEH